MKNKIYYIFLILGAMIFTSSTPQQTENISELKKIIEAQNEKYWKSIIENDMETFLSLYTDDAIVMPPFKPMIKGQEGLIDNWYENKRSGNKPLSASITTLEIWTSDDMVYERGSFGITLIIKGSNRPTSVYGSYFSIWKKQNDGSYKMKYDISNLDHGI